MDTSEMAMHDLVLRDIDAASGTKAHYYRDLLRQMQSGVSLPATRGQSLSVEKKEVESSGWLNLSDEDRWARRNEL